VLQSVRTACDPCPAGTYGTDPQRAICSVGTPGYVFGVATTSATPMNKTLENGYPCPKGYYCPKGTFMPLPCPAGTYQPLLAQSNSSSCVPCAPGTYQYLTGQALCGKCSSSSTSTLGAKLCSCVGKNRAFQPNDGFCICIPGYQFVDANMIVSSEKDGSYDCQPIVYTTCTANQVRAADGSCVSSSTYCTSVCGSAGGTFLDATGTCQCKNAKTLSEVCDATCLR
jgi:hypothetical protein